MYKRVEKFVLGVEIEVGWIWIASIVIVQGFSGCSMLLADREDEERGAQSAATPLDVTKSFTLVLQSIQLWWTGYIL